MPIDLIQDTDLASSMVSEKQILGLLDTPGPQPSGEQMLHSGFIVAQVFKGEFDQSLAGEGGGCTTRDANPAQLGSVLSRPVYARPSTLTALG